MPNLLKISKITQVDKGGEITDPTNLRPINFNSVSPDTKFENLVYKQLISYKYQFGFRKERSTAQAIIERKLRIL